MERRGFQDPLTERIIGCVVRVHETLGPGFLESVYQRAMLVEDKVVLELRTVEDFSLAHYAQVRSYLKATHLGIGLLVNFSKARSGFRRIEI